MAWLRARTMYLFQGAVTGVAAKCQRRRGIAGPGRTVPVDAAGSLLLALQGRKKEACTPATSFNVRTLRKSCVCASRKSCVYTSRVWISRKSCAFTQVVCAHLTQLLCVQRMQVLHVCISRNSCGCAFHTILVFAFQASLVSASHAIRLCACYPL